MKITYRVVAGTLMFCSAAFAVGSILTKHWVHWNKSTVQIHRGLWEKCITADSITCEKLSPKEKTIYLRVTQALMISSAVCILGGAVYLVIATLLKKLQAWIIAFIALTGDLTLVVAVSIYTAKIEIPSEKWAYGFSYGLAWASVLPSTVVVVMVFFIVLFNGRKDQRAGSI